MSSSPCSSTDRSESCASSSVTAHAFEAVRTWADVAVRVDRAAAERTLVSAGRHDRLGAPGEAARRLGCEIHYQTVGGLLVLALGQRESLDRHGRTVVIPREGHRADSKLLLDRLIQRRAVGLGILGEVDVAILLDLCQELLDPLGEHGDLLLLQRHRRQPVTFAGLEKERTLPRCADSPGDESVRRVVAM